MKKIYQHLFLYVAILSQLPVLTACKSDDADSSTTEPVATETINVDIILPNDVKAVWQPAINMAVENIGIAQKGLSKQVKLNLRYHDEQSSSLEQTLYSLCYPEEGADSCHLIIGPTDIDRARKTLSTADTRRVPVVMPTVAGDELQRIYADAPYAFFLTESDATQCEVLLSFLGTTQYIKKGALVYSDDTYGQSFRNWFGFMATEFKFGVAPEHIRAYTSGTDLTAWLTAIERETKAAYSHFAVVFAVNSLADIKSIISQIKIVRTALNLQPDDNYVTYYFTDHSDTPDVYSAGLSLYGLAPTSAPASGFDVAYEKSYGSHPANGAAQIYDALTTAALAAARRLNNPTGPDKLVIDGSPVEYRSAPYGPNLGDWMRALVADKRGPVTTWTQDGLRQAFQLIAQGTAPAVSGATGSLVFDAKMHNTILQTTYQLWRTDGQGQRYPLITFSTSGDNAAAGTMPIWEWEKAISDFDHDIVWDSKLPATTDHWALLVSTSTKWSDYRHQADVLAMYQLLRRHGYDDDHIVLVCEDNLKDAPDNKYPGKIYVEIPNGTSGDDVRAGAQIDYRFSDLDIDDIGRIILGDNDGGRLHQVMKTSSTSDVLIFWSGHGSDGRGMVWENSRQSTSFTGQRMRDILTQLNDRDGYRRCMLAIETCFSGLIGKAVAGLPDVVAITAANDLEPSKADVHDRTLGVFLSNAFARSFRQAVDDNPDISLRDLYYSLARTTTGSHVTLYNDVNYGSVYTLTARDYFPR
jgi:glycosylphosphatidylinositol transamidase (GPIT) subunit GPI8/ABC-type branched-subunit amino acid transport system substrate-binding protein